MRLSGSGRPVLLALSPRQQLRAGRLPRRLIQLLAGLFLYGASMALILRAGLGIEPWGVLHQGLTHYLPLSYGQVTIGVSLIVLLLWVPLRQWPGLGTICNAVLIGVFVDLVLGALPTPESLPVRIGWLVGGIALNGLAGAIYIGAQLGPGARDGLMTGLVARTGRPVWMIRTGIELVVVGIGFLLGGDLWIGTVLYAVGIGPLVQLFLPWVTVRLHHPATSPAGELAGVGDRADPCTGADPAREL
ncbi:membrane protein YczE [Microlunatus elymi]|uniref:membrane protein YczE n=1 Tax=Microlunatus elymi TaxID=2596828 RepID=UPI001AEF67CB|nr:hypothetical protein [Microlunatus elymi]